MRLRYTAAAVAPSDPRVIWAFSYGMMNGGDAEATTPATGAATADALGHLL